MVDRHHADRGAVSRKALKIAPTSWSSCRFRPELGPSVMARDSGGQAVRSRITIAAITAVLLSTAGCDLSGDDSESRVSKASYITRADEICRSYEKRSRAVEDRLEAGGSVSIEEAVKGWTEIRNLAERSQVHLRALQRPRGDEQVLARMFAAWDRGTGLVSDGISALRNGDAAQVEVIQRHIDAQMAKGNEIAADYGFKTCDNQAPE